MKTSLQAWLEQQIAGSVSLNALAVKWGYPSIYLIRWRDGKVVPELWRAAELAAKTGAPQEFLWRLIAEALEMRQREGRDRRLPPTSGGAAAALRPTPPAEPLPAVAARPITRGPGNGSTRHPRTGARRKHTENKTYSVDWLFDDWGQRAA